MRHYAFPTLIALAACIAGAGQTSRPVVRASGVTASRLPQNPLISVASSTSLGDNVNGPSIVRVPSWVKQPLGRYYMYFAHHTGTFIRLAYADSIQGPWKIYEPGVLHVRDSAFYRPQPDPPNSPGGFCTHVASPEIYLDSARNRIVMWFHSPSRRKATSAPCVNDRSARRLADPEVLAAHRSDRAAGGVRVRRDAEQAVSPR